MRFHGVTSIILAIIVFAMSMTVLVTKSVSAASAYGLFVIAVFLVIAYSYCAKCATRKRCSHVVLGMLTSFVPQRKTGPYTKADIAWMAAAFFALYAVSFAVLWPNKPMFAAALLLTAATVSEIKILVCPSCKNIYCPIKKL